MKRGTVAIGRRERQVYDRLELQLHRKPTAEEVAEELKKEPATTKAERRRDQTRPPLIVGMTA